MSENASTITVDVERYEREGFLVYPSVFTHDEVSALSDEADRMLELALNSTLALGEIHPRLRAIARNGRLDVAMFQPVNDLSPLVERVSTDERLISPMRAVMGAEPVLMEEKLNYKQSVDVPPELLKMFPEQVDRYFTERRFFPLHHDWGYYRQQGYPPDTISSAVAIDPTEGRGPLRVVPGSHLEEYPLLDPDPTHGNGQVVDGLFENDGDRVEVNVPEGSLIIFHSKLLHDSLANTSGLPRRLLIYSHYPEGTVDGDPDRRNAANRARAREFEEAYLQKVERGEYGEVVKL